MLTPRFDPAQVSSTSLAKRDGHPAQLPEKARKWVLKLYNDQRPDWLKWHDYHRTNTLVAHCAALSMEEDMGTDELAALYLAAWFSYTGWLFDPENALQVSQSLALQFLEAEKAPEEIRQFVKLLIPLAHLIGTPDNALGKVMWDAALATSYGSDYDQSQGIRRDEYEMAHQVKIPKAKWRAMEWEIVGQAQLYTSAGNALHGSAFLQVREALQPKAIVPPAPEETPVLPKPSGGDIQTYFRTTYHTHIHLSGIADRKAQILISINAILISVIISIISYSNLAETRPTLLIPICLFVIPGMVSLILAVLSARPKVTKRHIADLSPEVRKTHLLFFSHATQLAVEQYIDEMSQLLADRKSLQNAFHRDIYHLGSVLDYKFRLLHKAYTLFLLGFITSGLSFIIVELAGH